ncbi:unnamed protein product [Brassica oleracea var. botrytis]
MLADEICFCKQKMVNGKCSAGELHVQENCACPALPFGHLDCFADPTTCGGLRLVLFVLFFFIGQKIK